MHVPVAKGPPGSNVEVADNFIDAQPALDATPLMPLLGETFRVVLALTLFHGGAVAEGPGGLRVGFADLFAGRAAAGFFGVVGGWSAVAGATVGGVEVGGGFVGCVALGGMGC